MTETIGNFEAIAEKAYDAMPADFRDLTEGIVIRIDDWPSEEVLAAMNARSRYEILGLFDGVGRTLAAATPWTGQIPNMIWLYREPILDYWRNHDESLEDIVTHVLIHEIGHHFGLSDEDMDRIDYDETL